MNSKESLTMNPSDSIFLMHIESKRDKITESLDFINKRLAELEEEKEELKQFQVCMKGTLIVLPPITDVNYHHRLGTRPSEAISTILDLSA